MRRVSPDEQVLPTLNKMNNRDNIYYKDTIEARIKGPIARNIKPNLNEFKVWMRDIKDLGRQGSTYLLRPKVIP